jgi:DNA polymerase-3 subunit gamma/tau
MNIHELDAASNNSVEDIRSLVEQVRFAPQAGKYKVYIIDEVHMLSSSAFNAFLKTLEEPPPYAIFILATTEKHKILPTILSRCQIFDFKRITLQDTVEHLLGIAKKENIQADETALQLIAQKSEGCMRDALSILDKIVSFTNGEVNYNNTVEHLNILDADYYFKLVDCMLNQDLAGAMLLYDDIDKKGFEGDMVLNGFAEFLRNVLISKDERVIGLLEVVESFKVRFLEIAQRTDAGFLVSALNILNEAEINFRSARNKKLHVELTLVKLCYLQQALEVAGGNGKKKQAEAGRSISFRTLSPVAVKQTIPTAKQEQPAKLVIQTKAAPQEVVLEMPPPPPPPSAPLVPAMETAAVIAPPVEKERKGLSGLKKIREQYGEKVNAQEDQPLENQALRTAWKKYIVELKEKKNSAWASFESATLTIIDDHSFTVTVSNNIEEKFLEKERKNACEFLKKELHNKKLKFVVVIVAREEDQEPTDLPLSSKEQYLKLIEEYPLVKELKDRLRLELDY